MSKLKSSSTIRATSKDPSFLSYAREEDHYRDGHIPGAYELNPYHPEKELSQVLPLCQMAAQVVVYCTGGDCEDADSTALLLRDAGVPAPKLFVFGGGYTNGANTTCRRKRVSETARRFPPKPNERPRS